MSLQTFGRGLLFPHPGPGTTPDRSILTFNTTSCTIDAVNEVLAFVFPAPKTGNIRSHWFRMSTVTTGGNIATGIYAVSATTGDPANTPSPLAANTFATKTIDAADDNKWLHSGNYTADAAVVKGQLISVCFINPGASAGSMVLGSCSAFRSAYPYTSLFTGSWAKDSTCGMNLVLVYDDGSFECPLGAMPMGDAAGTAPITTTAFNTGSTPDAVGARFQFPGPVRVNGAWLIADADGDFAVRLVTSAWDGTTTTGAGGVLAQATLDTNQRQGTAINLHFVEFDTVVSLSPGTNYRLIVEPTSVTTLSIYDFLVNDADVMGTLPLGNNFHRTSAKNPNDDTDWTNYNNGTDGYRRPYMGLIVDGIGDDAGGGGGGGSRGFGLTGGMA